MRWKGPRPCWKCKQPVQWYLTSYSQSGRLIPETHLVFKGKHWVICKGSRVPAHYRPTQVKSTLSRKDLTMQRYREKLNATTNTTKS